MMDVQSQIDLCNENSTWLAKSRIQLVEGILKKEHQLIGEKLEIIDIGCGAGSGISTWSRYGYVDGLEPGSEFLKILESNLDIRDLYREHVPTDAINKKYDVAICLDVIEHIQEDEKALSWVLNMLKSNGIAIFTVPAYQWLFSDHDRAVSHFRRYSKRRFRLILPANSKVVKDTYFVTLLFLPAVIMRFLWQLKRVVYTHIFRNKQKIKKQSSNFNPIFDSFLSKLQTEEIKKLEKYYMPFGLSYFCVVKKND
jgi:2-polyprenyl-3-methyl-5-hydroxy-6-metoxy-1,4-benzoquinol methylase